MTGERTGLEQGQPAEPSAASKQAPTAAPSGRGRAIALGVLALMVLLQGLEAIPFQEQARAFVFDRFQRIVPRSRPSSPVLIVDIDEASLERFGQWPWPRSLLAQLIAAIHDRQPAAIGLDILMPESDRGSPCDAARLVPEMSAELIEQVCAMPSNDERLAQVLERGRIALAIAGTSEVDAGGDRGGVLAAPVLTVGGDPAPLMRHFAGALGSLESLQRAARGHAMINGDGDGGSGVVRRIPLVATIGDTVVPTMAIELLRLASGSPTFSVHRSAWRIDGVAIGDLFVPTQADGSVWIHYGRHDASRYVSATRVLDGSIDPSLLEKRLVLVGVSGLGLVDFPVNALGERVPGVDMHAQLIESIFDGTTILRPAWAPWAEVGATAAIGIALIFGLASLHSMLAIGAALASTASLFLLGLGLYSNHAILFDPATSSLLLVALLGGLLIHELLREQVRRRALEASLHRQREAAARLAGEMAAARRIQLGLLPDLGTTFAGDPRIDIAARMESAREVGGDLYDCFMLDEHRAFLLLGDVCGKGVPASLFMATSKTLCKSVALRDGEDLGRLMREVNREIARDNPEMLFVTVFAGILDLRTGELWHANAGHEKPYVVAPGQPPRRLEGESGLPFGLVEDADYPTARYHLAPDEFLCVVSDGVSEATDPEQAPFGPERLAATLAEIRPTLRSGDVLLSIVRAVARFAAGSEASDDVTILVVRCRPN
jgi:adenylate cyclase